MKIHRIYAIILRFYYLNKRQFDKLSDAFYWPIIDLVLWGLASTYFVNQAPQASKLLLVIISGILLWIIVWRGQYEITVNLLEELWNKNLINLFASPLRFSEWIMSLVMMGLIKATISFSFASLIAYLLYKTNVFYYGFYLLFPESFILFLSCQNGQKLLPILYPPAIFLKAAVIFSLKARLTRISFLFVSVLT